jgi:hypothetical protein
MKEKYHIINIDADEAQTPYERQIIEMRRNCNHLDLPFGGGFPWVSGRPRYSRYL